MFKKLLFNKVLINVGVLITMLCLIAVAFFYWAMAFIPDDATIEKLRTTKANDLVYLQQALPKNRGKILAVVTSVKKLGDSGKITGYELSELSRAYWVFTINGFEVDVTSPQGGEPYALLDNDDMGAFDYAFLNDPLVQQKIKNTLPLDKINPDNYQAIYFVGGKGAMFDFPDNLYIQRLIKNFVEQEKLIIAVCHGPAALVNVKDAEGKWLFSNKSMTSFTNTEELLLIPEADKVLPFLLQSRLEQQGAHFQAGADYLENIIIEKGLITGQNPWSVWRLAEVAIRQLGYEPVARELTSEENSVELLKVYQQFGLDNTEKLVHSSDLEYNGHLILMHAFVTVLKGELKNAAGLVILADTVKEFD